MARNSTARLSHTPRQITSSFSVSPVREALNSGYSQSRNYAYSISAVRSVNGTRTHTSPSTQPYQIRVPKQDKVHLTLHEGTLNEGASFVRSVLVLFSGIVIIVAFVLFLNSYATSIAYENSKVQAQIIQVTEEIEEEASKSDNVNVPNAAARAGGLGMVQRQGVTQLYLSNNQIAQVNPDEKTRDYLTSPN